LNLERQDLAAVLLNSWDSFIAGVCKLLIINTYSNEFDKNVAILGELPKMNTFDLWQLTLWH